MMSVTLVSWLLVRIERNLRSITGSLVRCFPAFLLYVQSVTVTEIHFHCLNTDQQLLPIVVVLYFRLLYTTERLRTCLPVDMHN
jgi:hypothetical protein